MNNYEVFELGSVPAEEPCAQVGDADYAQRAREECHNYIALLRRHFGPEPEGAKLYVKRNRHDYGSYSEVAVRVDTTKSEAVAYAYRIDANAPLHWDAPLDSTHELS